ncbi:MAG: hypothetical protein ABFD60_12220, partial [Bryobacteraceae bacterium]
MSAYCARIAVLALAVIAIATAQTRTGEIERARDQKAVQLQPETVSSSENVMLEVKRRKVLERLTAGYNGLRATIGGMATGSGFAAGPDFLREDFAGGRVRVNASALISTRLWQKYQAGVSLPHLAGDHLLVGVEAVRRDYRSLEFYGPGPDSRRSGRTAYRLEDTNLEGVAAV